MSYNGSFIGKPATTSSTNQSASGIWSLKEQQILLSTNSWPHPFATSGLQLFWDPGDTSSYSGTGNILYDLSGNNRNGTIVNSPSYSTSIGSGSFAVNTTSQSQAQYINGGNLGAVGNTGTFNMWFYTTNWVSYNNPMGTSGLTGGTNVGFRVEQYNTGGGNAMGIVNGNDAGQLNGQNIIPDGQGLTNVWYNLCFSWNKTNNSITYYLNGSLVATLSTTFFASNLNGLTWGNGFSTTRYFQGNLGAFMYYSSELNLDQVVQNYNYHRVRYGR